MPGVGVTAAVARRATATSPHERKMTAWSEPGMNQTAFRHGLLSD
jgi:hypothetical protein